MGSEALLHGPRVLRVKRLGEAVSGGYVVRLLPRGAKSSEAAGRSRESQVGELSLERRSAISVDRPDLRLEWRFEQLHVPTRSHGTAGHDRYVSGFHGQYQQPPHHECG